jgi:hypothetical protein
VDAAKDLNTVLQPDPPIDIRATVVDLERFIKEASQLLNSDDVIEDNTRMVIDELGVDEEETDTATAPEPVPEPVAPAAAAPRTRGRAAGASATPPVSTSTPGRGGRAYSGSQAERMDLAAIAGGTIEEIAAACDSKPGIIRQHLKYRTAKGKWTVDQSGDGEDAIYKMSKVESESTTA